MSMKKQIIALTAGLIGLCGMAYAGTNVEQNVYLFQNQIYQSQVTAVGTNGLTATNSVLLAANGVLQMFSLAPTNILWLTGIGFTNSITATASNFQFYVNGTVYYLP